MYVMIYGADVPDALRAVTGRARVEVVLSFDVDEFSEKAEGSFSVGGGVRDITVKKVQTSDGQNPIILKMQDEAKTRRQTRTHGTMG
jgi:hypothetical protein